MLPDDDKRYAIETCRSSESVLKNWFKINYIQLVHLLVMWYLVNLQDARCNNKDKDRVITAANNTQCYSTTNKVLRLLTPDSAAVHSPFNNNNKEEMPLCTDLLVVITFTVPYPLFSSWLFCLVFPLTSGLIPIRIWPTASDLQFRSTSHVS